MKEIDDAGWRALLAAGRSALVSFHAPWSGGAKQQRPVLARADEVHGARIEFCRYDLASYHEIANELVVEILPTTAFLRGGQVVFVARSYLDDEALARLIREHF